MTISSQAGLASLRAVQPDPEGRSLADAINVGRMLTFPLARAGFPVHTLSAEGWGIVTLHIYGDPEVAAAALSINVLGVHHHTSYPLTTVEGEWGGVRVRIVGRRPDPDAEGDAA